MNKATWARLEIIVGVGSVIVAVASLFFKLRKKGRA